MSAPEEAPTGGVALPKETLAAEVAPEEKEAAPTNDLAVSQEQPNGGSLVAGVDAPAWEGLAKIGTYKKLSKGSALSRWAPHVGPDGDDENNYKPGSGLGNVYFFVSLERNKRSLYIGPGDVLALKNGEKVVYLAMTTHKGLVPTFIVCSEARTDPKEVAFRDVVSLVRPLDIVDTAWVKPVLLGYVQAVRDARAQGLAV
jgi:hypothetical protein